MTQLGTPHGPDDPPKSNVLDEPLLVSARLDKPVVAVGAAHKVHCVLEISGVAAPAPAERAPIDLVLVVDRSGSMAGHLGAVRSYVEFLMERLTSADRVALVVHAEEPELIVPLASPDGRVVDAIEALSARGRTEVSAAWRMAVGIVAAAGERGATGTIALFTDLRPNLGEAEPAALNDLIRQWGEHTRHPASFMIPFRFDGPGADPAVGLHRVGLIDDAPDAFAKSFPGLLPTAALDVEVEVTTAEGVAVHEIPERYEIGRRPLKLGNLYQGAPRRLVFSLSVPPRATPGIVQLGNVVLRYAPIDDPEGSKELRVRLAVAVTEGEAAAIEPDLEVTQVVANQKYWAVKRAWDRVVSAGTRKALADAAAELRAMGAVGALLADKLMRRLAELAREDQRIQRVLDWCDRAPSGRLLIVGEAHGTVGWVPIDALPLSRAKKRTEDGRRLLMAGVARMASIIEASASAAPAVVQREYLPDEPLSSVESDVFGFMDWRFDPERDFVPAPVPDEITRWWEDHRGLVSVRCRLHGEIARLDASRSIGMLGAAWDAAVVEYHNRWELAWEETYDTEYDGCEVRIEATSEPGSANLLDVMEMWIVTEGSVRPWWVYELLPSEG